MGARMFNSANRAPDWIEENGWYSRTCGDAEAFKAGRDPSIAYVKNRRIYVRSQRGREMFDRGLIVTE